MELGACSDDDEAIATDFAPYEHSKWTNDFSSYSVIHQYQVQYFTCCTTSSSNIRKFWGSFTQSPNENDTTTSMRWLTRYRQSVTVVSDTTIKKLPTAAIQLSPKASAPDLGMQLFHSKVIGHWTVEEKVECRESSIQFFGFWIILNKTAEFFAFWVFIPFFGQKAHNFLHGQKHTHSASKNWQHFCHVN